MSLQISLDVNNDSLKFKIPLANYCWNCVNDWDKSIKIQDCDMCNNKRVELTDNGKKIIGLVLKTSSLLHDFDLKELTDRDDRNYYR